MLIFPPASIFLQLVLQAIECNAICNECNAICNECNAICNECNAICNECNAELDSYTVLKNK